MKAPLSMLRYKAMTEDYLTPIDRTLELTGPAPYTMDEAIDETLDWLENRSQWSTAALRTNRMQVPHEKSDILVTAN